jgi:hypothetical protein
MTVVAKAEFAQSYITQPQTVFLSDFKAPPPDHSMLDNQHKNNRQRHVSGDHVNFQLV